jgi:hypothetical protein
MVGERDIGPGFDTEAEFGAEVALGIPGRAWHPWSRSATGSRSHPGRAS